VKIFNNIIQLLKDRGILGNELVGGDMLKHDVIAHPLIGLSGGAPWAYKLHDEYASNFDTDRLNITGNSEQVENLLDVMAILHIDDGMKITRHRDGNVLSVTLQRK
jgi:hypothetical protein